MNNIKATFADTRGHARRGSQRPPPPIGPRVTPTCCASGIRRQTRQTASPFMRPSIRSENVRNVSLPMTAGRIWHGPSDNARVRILTDMFCQKPRVETPRFRVSHKKTALAATTRITHEKARAEPSAAVLRK